VATTRARAREELVAEIKRSARRHLVRDGAAGLSLRAVARDLEMVSSAVYRYFPSREDLLTALIIDAYDAFGAAAERAEATVSRDDLMGRWMAVAHAAYRWSGRHSAEYALIFGSPVPGYRAPSDTIGPATRFTTVLLRILEDAHAAGLASPVYEPLSAPVLDDVQRLRSEQGLDIEPDQLAGAIRAWTGLIGLITFIRFGHLHKVVRDHESFFDDSVRRLGRSVICEVSPPR
jgi:AcrR family transcriptional regulator